MKKLTTTLLAILFYSGLQAQAFEQGSSYVSVGYGFGNFIQAFMKTVVSGSDATYSSFGPAFLKYEYGIAEKIGLGLNVAYMGAKISANDSYTDPNNGNTVVYRETISFTTTSLLARMNFHFGDNDMIDPYFGFGLGYRTGKFSWKADNPQAPEQQTFKDYSPFGMEITFGTRFLFTENLGAYVELGMAKAVFQLGLTAKF